MVEASVVPRQRLHEGGNTRRRRRCRLRPRQEQAFTRHGHSHPTDQLVHPSFPLPTGRAAAIHWSTAATSVTSANSSSPRGRGKPILPPPPHHHNNSTAPSAAAVRTQIGSPHHKAGLHHWTDSISARPSLPPARPHDARGNRQRAAAAYAATTRPDQTQHAPTHQTGDQCLPATGRHRRQVHLRAGPAAALRAQIGPETEGRLRTRSFRSRPPPSPRSAVGTAISPCWSRAV